MERLLLSEKSLETSSPPPLPQSLFQWRSTDQFQNYQYPWFLLQKWPDEQGEKD